MHNLPFNLSQDTFNLDVLVLGIILVFLVGLFKKNNYQHTKYYHFYRENKKNNNRQNSKEKKYNKYNNNSHNNYSYNNSYNNSSHDYNNSNNSSSYNYSYNYYQNYKNNDKKNNTNNKKDYKNNFNSTDPFEILGCYKDDDFQTIKKQYFKLVKEFHPDKIKSLGLNEDFVAFATYRTQIINQAFEQIKKYYK